MLSSRRWATALLCIAFLPSLCEVGRAASAEEASLPTLARNLFALEEATNALAQPGADARKVLLRAWARTSGAGRETVGTQIATFLDRAPAPGAWFPCGADFLRDRARRELRRLKDILLDIPPWPAEPEVCHSLPVAVDATHPVDTVEIYGQDFDRVSWELFVMNNEGFFEDVSFALRKRSHSHLSIELGANGAKLPPDSQALALVWGHLVRYWIPVVHPSTPLCDSAIEEVRGGKTIAYAPFPIAGGKRFDGAGARVVANIALDYESNKIDAMVCLTAAARTLISGCASEYVYTTDPERTIEWVFGNLEAGIAYAPSGRLARQAREGAAGSPIARWTFDGIAAEPVGSAEAGISVRLRKLQAVTTRPERCVSAIRYLEARRQNAIGSDTARRLDARLREVDVRIRKLRPRFAPPLH